MNVEKTIRKPQQKRSLQMKEKILEVTTSLLSEKGYYNITTNEIAKTANISIGSLYSYFKDKDTILMEILERYNQHFLIVFDNTENEMSDQLYQSDKRKWMRLLITNLIDLHESVKPLIKQFNILYYAMPEVAAVMDMQSEKVRSATLESLIQHQEDIHIKDIEVASIVIVDFITAIVDRIVFKEEIVETERILDAAIDVLYKFLVQ